ncbi:hypothetical protein BH10PSE13_BH10PSE13_10180 [soil metagenome]
MPVIAPLAMDAIDTESRARIESGLATGMYSQTLPLQVLAHSPNALRALDEGYKAFFRRSLLDDRLCELLRLRSAMLNACGPCSVSRKEGSVGEEDVACLIDPVLLQDTGKLTRRERLALDYMTRMSTDPASIDRDAYAALKEDFSPAEIIELGWTCSQTIAGHRFMHGLDLLDAEAPVEA